MARTSQAALDRIDRLQRDGGVPPSLAAFLRKRFQIRQREFDPVDESAAAAAARSTAQYRALENGLIDAQRAELIKLRDQARSTTRCCDASSGWDLESEEIDLLDAAGHAEVNE